MSTSASGNGFIKNGKIESRDMTVGNGQPAFLTGNLGSFVPLVFFQDVKAAQKNTDALFNPDVVTYVETTHGKPIQFGYYGDTENVANLVSESNLATEQDIFKRRRRDDRGVHFQNAYLPRVDSKHSKTSRWLAVSSSCSKSSAPTGSPAALDLTSLLAKGRPSSSQPAC